MPAYQSREDQIANLLAPALTPSEAVELARLICRGETGNGGPMSVPLIVDSAGRPISGTGASLPVAHVLASTAPNRSLNDTGAGAGVSDQPFGVAFTVPGALMRETSKLLVWSGVDWTLGNFKNHFIKIGPVSGTYATATQVSGWSNFNTQTFSAVSALICNDGVRNRQRSTPANAVSWLNGHANNMVVTNIDTDVDWNIYVGAQHGTLNGGSVATERDFFALWLP